MINPVVPEPTRSTVSVNSTCSTSRTHISSERIVERGWQIDKSTPWSARLERRTAESAVEVEVELTDRPSSKCSIDVADSIHVAGIGDLLAEFAVAAGFGLEVSYNTTLLSSSHVVAEDIGMTIGRALRLIAVERMETYGIHGAGSSLQVPDLPREAVRVGVSMEGRKFWKYVPMGQDYSDFRRSFLIGHTLPNGIFSEDLDDFVDGLAGGMLSSIIVHVDNGVDPKQGWPMLFRGLGKALEGLLRINPHRRSLTPGVKATLA